MHACTHTHPHTHTYTCIYTSTHIITNSAIITMEFRTHAITIPAVINNNYVIYVQVWLRDIIFHNNRLYMHMYVIHAYVREVHTHLNCFHCSCQPYIFLTLVQLTTHVLPLMYDYTLSTCISSIKCACKPSMLTLLCHHFCTDFAKYITGVQLI